jgi:predicted TIM-barrel fold metal-dependent hydrolase
MNPATVSSRPRQTPTLRRLIRWSLACLLGLAAALVGARAVLFTGPYRTPASLPHTRIIDLHVHIAGIGAGDSGCFVSRQMEQSWKFGIYLKSFGTSRAELAAQGDAPLVDRIAAQVAASRHVSHAVILAMDGAMDAAGELDRTATEVHVPNEFVAREVARHTNLLFGASVNPNRHDALARLDWCATNGAVLVKWIPSIMHIDPADERLIPFYERLKFHQLPLLTHAGQERSFTHADDRLADPERLRLPLRLGVTVIAAHIASTGENGGERDTDRLARLMKEFPNLLSEISSLTQANKPGYLKEALIRPEFAGRLAYGSDFPLINTALVSPWLFHLRLERAEMARLADIANPWDRDVELKQSLGVAPEIFARTETLLAPRLKRLRAK